ncbi:hypothetical protein B5E64_02385 [Drancourtella sp. An12]|uniref:hypothetical protein n=1 Tax=Drancourtella sp. An12 TaxID=1965548 RepID=UPI000B3930A5|nr:hypothetical protein [Drancourtella sp. An12]OUQ46887.1 hypothetical protein B5E64_02385 [Drancourtella sp. An12]
MDYGRSLRRPSLHSTRNFEQERADLREGMNNLIQAYQKFIVETLQDDTLSTAEKTGRLQAYCRQPPLTVIRAILSGQTGTSPAINRYAAKGSLHE